MPPSHHVRQTASPSILDHATTRNLRVLVSRSADPLSKLRLLSPSTFDLWLAKARPKPVVRSPREQPQDGEAAVRKSA